MNIHLPVCLFLKGDLFVVNISFKGKERTGKERGIFAAMVYSVDGRLTRLVVHSL